MQPIHLSEERNRWIPFMLSDRVVLIRMIGYNTTICAVMVDPSLDNSSLFAGMSDSDMHHFLCIFGRNTLYLRICHQETAISI